MNRYNFSKKNKITMELCDGNLEISSKREFSETALVTDYPCNEKYLEIVIFRLIGMDERI